MGCPPADEPELLSPFGKINGLDRDDFREAAYEIFFTAFRSSPGSAGRNPITNYEGDVPGSPAKPHYQGVGMAVTSRVKTALGLKMLQRSTSSSSRRSSLIGLNNPSSPGTMSPRVNAFNTVPPRLKRPKTATEIMRQQMRVTEQSDNRLRKTLIKTLVGQMGRRAETIILPLELLRHLRPSEFEDPEEYHFWQRRQLRVLEAGLLLHPSTPLKKSDRNAAKLRDLIRASDSKPLDTSRTSRQMKDLSDSATSLAWRGSTTDVCHWADGYPLNVHIYMALLSTMFDLKDGTLVLDEVDELLELMKKTWTILGLTRPIHNLCLAWVLFEQFVVTGQTAPDLLGGAFVMLREVEGDAKKVDQDPVYVKMLASVLDTIRKWSEKRLLDYHACFGREMVGQMESMLTLLFSSSKILEDVPLYIASSDDNASDEVLGNRIEHCIRSTLRNAFARIVEQQNGVKGNEAQTTSEALMKLADKTEELAMKEKEIFSPVLKKWSPDAAGIAAVTLHSCFAVMMKQYITGKSWLMNDVILALRRAGKLEESLVEMVVEESNECEDGGKGIVRQMVPYEVETVITRLFKQWIQERLQKGKDHLLRAKQNEVWKPRSKTEPYTQSAVDLIAFAKEAMESFFQLSVNVSENMFNDFINGLEKMILDYITFVAACGSQQSYLPSIPPLMRCSNDSTIFKLWRKAACGVGANHTNWDLCDEDNNHLRASITRETQRLYIRLNTLHYLISQLHSLEKLLSVSLNATPSKAVLSSRRQASTLYFEKSLLAIQTASRHVSQVAAYRLIFVDSNTAFYGSLYIGDVSRARIGPAIQSLKYNLSLLCTIVIEPAQPLALREVMKASFEAFLRVLLAGGSSRVFYQGDQPMIEEDLDNLKRIFYTCGDGLIVENMVESEAEAAHGVVTLMGHPTAQLIDDFISVVSHTNGVNTTKHKHKLPVPPTTGKWSRSDPNTILRVLCCRKDRAANYFLKKTFKLPKRRPGIRMM